MDIRWQAFVLVGIILVSVALTNVGRFGSESSVEGVVVAPEGLGELEVPLTADLDGVVGFSFPEVPTLDNGLVEVGKIPVRNWSVFDPKVFAEAVLVQSVDDRFPFFHYNTYKVWPAASLTKLLTSVVVLEEIGAGKKIVVTANSVNTEGEAGGLRDGEIYTAQDLLKIMLLASSNDAATAFEDHVGGRDEFARLLGEKASQLGMDLSVFVDGSGLSDLNRSTASDLLRLTRYIMEEYPEIFRWTRMPSFLVQPVNSVESRLVYNINPLVLRSSFLGGKTGTSPSSRQNLITVFSLGEYRMVMVILGSDDRFGETDGLVEWVKEAYGL